MQGGNKQDPGLSASQRDLDTTLQMMIERGFFMNDSSSLQMFVFWSVIIVYTNLQPIVSYSTYEAVGPQTISDMTLIITHE